MDFLLSPHFAYNARAVSVVSVSVSILCRTPVCLAMHIIAAFMRSGNSW